jgi:hypothetical protein
VARAVLSPRLASRVSAQELEAFVSLSVAAYSACNAVHAGTGGGCPREADARGGQAAGATGGGGGGELPRVLCVLGDGARSSLLVPGYLMDGVRLGKHAARKLALLERCIASALPMRVILYSCPLEPAPPAYTSVRVQWERAATQQQCMRKDRDKEEGGGRGCGSKGTADAPQGACTGDGDGGGEGAWVSADLAALMHLVLQLEQAHVTVVMCQRGIHPQVSALHPTLYTLNPNP